jgi:hypothetical protein
MVLAVELSRIDGRFLVNVDDGEIAGDVEGTPAQGPASGNPLGTSLNVLVSVPESIEVRMVNASALADYEMWVFLASVLSNAVCGFVVAAVQARDSKATNSNQLIATSVVFGVLFLATAIKAFVQRLSLTKAGKSIKLRATEALPEG